MKENLSKELWLTAENTRRVMAALSAEGATPRFVGGVVRDSLLGRSDEVSEIDIAIDRPPETIEKLLATASIKPLPIGAAHGTIACVVDGQSYEITSLRVDVLPDGRHAEVAFTRDWRADAERRDFTVNAIYADGSGAIHDPLDGRADLAAGHIRFIGDAGARIREDYLRILRFFRFFAGFAEGDADQAALSACHAERAGLAQLSAERIAAELFKLLAAARAPEALRLMAASDILPLILPHAERSDIFSRMHALMVESFITPDPLLLFSALYTTRENLLADGRRLKLSNAQLARLEKILPDDSMKLRSYLSIREVRGMLYRAGAQMFADRIWRAWAEDKNPRNAIGWRALLAMADSWERPNFLLTGEMVKSAGVPEGAEIGRVMREVEEWWVNADFIDDKFSLIERLKAVVQATIYNERP